MNVIENLLSAQRRECEEKRHFIAELANLAERFRADAARLHREREKASDVGSAGTAGSMTVEPRSLSLRARMLEASIAEIDGRIAAARAALETAEEKIRRRERAIRDQVQGQATERPKAQ